MAAPSSKKTILLVEDEALIAMNEAAMLKKYGYVVITAYNALKAIETAAAENIDLILMDIDLGEGETDGTEVAEQLVEKYDIPIVFLSSHTEPDVVERTEGITSYGYIDKNSGEPVLLASIRMAFRLHDAYLARKKSEQRFRMVSELSSDYAYCHRLLEDGSLEPVWSVGSFDAITGYTPEELYNRGGWSRLIHPDDIPGAAHYVQTLLSGEEAVFTARIITKNGGIRWIQDRGKPWIDEETGMVIGTYGSAEDVTEVKKREEELRLSEEKYKQLYENAPLPYQSLDENGCFLDVNPAWLETLGGYDREDVLGKSFSNFIHADSLEDFKRNLAELKESGEAYDNRYKLRKKNGEYIDVSFQGQVAYALDGTFQRTHCVFENITERLKAEKQKDYLMQELNHRVKNNLLMISSLINLRNATLENGVDLSDLIGQIDAIRMIHEQLFLSKDITRIEVKEYIEGLLPNLFSLSPDQVTLETAIEVKTLNTRIALPLGLIINEIATNAMKYGFSDDSTPRFTVQLKVADSGKHYLLSLSNTGNPFPEDIDIINPKTLGLRLVTALTEQLGGTLDLRRKPSPRFTFLFPIDGK